MGISIVNVLVLFLACIYFGMGGDLFNRQHIGVWYDSYNSATDSRPELDEDVINQFISTVSTRFYKVVLRDVNLNTDFVRKVVKVTAKYNANRNSSQNAIELVLLVQNPTDRQWLNRTLEGIAQANLIYAGTVSTVLLYMIVWHPSNFVSFIPHMDYIRNTLPNIKIWGQLPTYKLCTGYEIYGTEEVSKLPVMPYFEKVVVTPYFFQPSSRKMRTNSEVTTALGECVERFREVSVELAIETNWWDPNDPEEKNVTNLMAFWSWMNEWAVQKNTVVIMQDAFDRLNDREYKGWWKWEHVDGMYKFTEKTETPPPPPTQTMAPPPPTEARPAPPPQTTETPPPPPQTMTPPPPTEARPTPPPKTMAPPTTPMLERETPPVVDSSDPTVNVYVIAVVCVLALGAIIVALLVFRWKNKQVTALQEENITSEEISFFFEGEGAPTTYGSTLTPTIAINVKYKKELEVPTDCFDFDNNSSLGSGAFGSVHKGTIFKFGESTDVAVKMTKPFSPATAVRSILMEIKILSFLGHHPNIVSILGAHTSDLDKGKVYLFLELCPVGSLEKYLRQNRGNFVDANSERYVVQPVQTRAFCQSDLHQWVLDVVNGMEFLASKHVVHADLATRNILLGCNKQAKICDFGLSRRMYDYACYKKSQKDPLPWRWMAPESLMYLEFNEKTDVWAFGVTMWEIYSFGKIPYAGLSWTIDFACKTLTEEKLRPEKPRLATDHMYGVMSKCWDLQQASRPTFSELRRSLDANQT